MVISVRKSVRGLGRWIAISTGVFSGTLVLFAYSQIFWMTAGLLAAIGFCVMIQMGSSNTLIQSMTPDHLRGRVLAAYSMMLMGIMVIISGNWGRKGKDENGQNDSLSIEH